MTRSAPTIVIREVGLVPYPEGLVLQDEAREEVLAGVADGVILAVRHPPTLTLGRRARWEEVHVSAEERRRLRVELYYADRGGGATYHGPDQAVVYPVVHLDRLGLGVEDLLRCLADATLAFLAGEGVAAAWDPERPGVYVGGAKIASVGLHVSQGVTTHGLAVNIGPDIAGFDLIDPCKSPGLVVTGLSRVTGLARDPDAVAASLARDVADRLRALARSDTMNTARRTRRSRGDRDGRARPRTLDVPERRDGLRPVLGAGPPRPDPRPSR